jgi:hypothetical protein
MKIKDPDVMPIGPWHPVRVGLFPKRTYDGRWIFPNTIAARRRVKLKDETLCPSSRER